MQCNFCDAILTLKSVNENCKKSSKGKGINLTLTDG